MHNETTSRHIRSSSELMIMVPIRNEFVPITDRVMSYAARISSVLQALSELRQLKVERGFGDPIGPIERMQTIYRVQWTVIESFDDVTTSAKVTTRQFHGPQVALTSHFDSSWENYFQALVSIGGPLLDLIFSHCQGYDGSSCEDGYEAFSSFIRLHQRRCDFLYALAPEMTIDDVRYYAKYNSADPQLVSPVEIEARQKVAREAKDCSGKTEHDPRTRAALRAIQGLYDLRERLFLNTGGLQFGKGVRTDRDLFDNAVASTLEREPELYRLGLVLKNGRDSRPKLYPARELEKARVWIDAIVKEKLNLTDKLTHLFPGAPLMEAASHPPPVSVQPESLSKLYHDVQGNILNSYLHADTARLLLLRCHDSGGLQSVLTWAKANFTSEADGREPPVHINFGLTYYGLKLLELPRSVIEWFPREFREGMEERAGILGDVFNNHPREWKLPLHRDGDKRAHLSTIHVAIVLQAQIAADIDEAITALEIANERGETVHQLSLRPERRAERSQPVPIDLPSASPQASKLDLQALGEFLLGHKNRIGDVAACTDPKRNRTGWAGLFQNGSFMAMRKMQRDDRLFLGYVKSVANQLAKQNPKLTRTQRSELEHDVAALIIGQRVSDSGLPGQAANPSNNFDYHEDDGAKTCPLDSHIRRTNPRQTDTPRIARRSIAYDQPQRGPDGEEKGLLFMAYCASLGTQYEVVQRWVNGGNSTGLPSRQTDPLCGASLYPKPNRRVRIPDAMKAKYRLTQECELRGPNAPFVSLRWGMYLFMPSLTALYRLCDFERDDRLARDPAAIERGALRIDELNALSPERRVHEWKRLLEEAPDGDSPQALQARDVSAAITEHGGAVHFTGVVPSADGTRNRDVVVVTKVDLARTVLSGSGAFSVKEYRERLDRALSDHYLGYDLSSTDRVTGLSYEQLSSIANAAFAKLAGRAAKNAYRAAEQILLSPNTLELSPDGDPLEPGTLRSTISIRDLALGAVGKLCKLWMQTPGAEPSEDDDIDEEVQSYIPLKDETRRLMRAVERLIICSRYCFQALPGSYLTQRAAENKESILTDYETIALKQSPIAKAAAKSFLTANSNGAQTLFARKKLPAAEAQRLQRMVLMGAVGFAPPAVGAVTRVLDYWIENEQFWQLQSTYNALAGEDNQALREASLRRAVFDALSRAPAPPTLYRTATAQVQLGKVTVPTDALVIVDLAAVYTDALRTGDKCPHSWFFGGLHGGSRDRDNPQHGCPGRDAGLLAIEQIIAALFARTNIRRERRFVVSYDRETNRRRSKRA